MFLLHSRQGGHECITRNPPIYSIKPSKSIKETEYSHLKAEIHFHPLSICTVTWKVDFWGHISAHSRTDSVREEPSPWMWHVVGTPQPLLGRFSSLLLKQLSKVSLETLTEKKTPQDWGHHVPAVVSESQSWLLWRAHTQIHRHKSNP